MNSQISLKSKQDHQAQRKKSLIKHSVGLIGSIGMGVATIGLVTTQVQATSSNFELTIKSTPSKPAPVINTTPTIKKTVKIKPSPKLSPPQISVPSNSPTRVKNISPSGKNSYLDTNIYTTKVRQTPPKTPAVIVKSRTTGCQTIVTNGSINNGNCGKNTPQITTRKSSPPVVSSNHNSSRQTSNNRSHKTNRNYYSYRNSSSSRSVPPEYSHALRRKHIENNGNTALLFPLSLPARISSTFGWRVHPISGSRRMHYGTDLAAPMGTPVLAAYEGKVAIADNLGGYGLTVILRHQEGNQESRYAHLSEIFVNPGEWVEQGSVIGLVGSTGFSTGPHLHFEWRHLTKKGWVAVDAGLHLESALDNLIKSLQLAQAKSDSSL
jgi:murein DD-endopeptidase MepM/ murein hydrolase activator NlpD